MRSKIIQTLQSDLKSNVGLDSSYETLKVEEIQERIPKTIGTNIFIGIDIDSFGPLQEEIGGFIPVIYEYNVIIALLVKDGNIPQGQTNLDIIARRILKYLASGADKLNGTTITTDGVTECIQGFNLAGLSYTSGELKETEVGHIAVFDIKVKTNLNIN